MTETGGIYVHVPFCKSKCLYCDFYTGGARIADWSLFSKCLVNELKSRSSEISFQPHTLYIGGGTPSILPVDHLKKLIHGINDISNQKLWREFTIEINPEDVSLEKIIAWKEAGINRVSLGIQSFHDQELKAIGRNYDSDMARGSLEKLMSHFDNVSVDIMFGIPGQTYESYLKSLDILNKIRPHHISSYSLMLEEGTAITLLVSQNKIMLPSEDEWLKMFHLTTDFLRNSGYIRYEISNYSLPGKESVHNHSYWHGLPYIGLGPGAHSYDGVKCRRANPNDIKGYLRHFSRMDNSLPFFKEEILSDKELKEEMVMTRLRTSKGLSYLEFCEKFGEGELKRFLHKVSPYIKTHLMKESYNHISFTDDGFIISDSILSSLI